MKRREFVAGLAGAVLAPPIIPLAQGNSLRHVSVLVGAAQEGEGRARVSALPKGLSAIGWEDGSNLRIDIRYVGASLDVARSLASETVASRPDVIVASGTATV